MWRLWGSIVWRGSVIIRRSTTAVCSTIIYIRMPTCSTLQPRSNGSGSSSWRINQLGQVYLSCLQNRCISQLLRAWLLWLPEWLIPDSIETANPGQSTIQQQQHAAGPKRERRPSVSSCGAGKYVGCVSTCPCVHATAGQMQLYDCPLPGCIGITEQFYRYY